MRKTLLRFLGSLFLLCCLLSIHEVFFVHVAKAQTIISSQFNEVKPHKSFQQKTEFMYLVQSKLRKAGYHTTIASMLYAQPGKHEITIEISNSEYKGEQTTTNINKIVKQVARENKLGPVVVRLSIN